MKMNRSKIVIITVCSILLGAGITYQNCGPMSDQADNQDSTSKTFTTSGLENSKGEVPAAAEEFKPIPSIFESLKVEACRDAKGCSPITFTVKGLVGALKLKTNVASEELEVKSDGSYKFNSMVAAKVPLIVEAIQSPKDQVCEVSRDEGDGRSGGLYTASAFSVLCYDMHKGCKEGQKLWTMPTAGQFLNGVSVNDQPALGMSEDLKAVIFNKTIIGSGHYVRGVQIDMSGNSLFGSTVPPAHQSTTEASADQNASGDIVVAWKMDTYPKKIRVAQKIGPNWQPTYDIPVFGESADHIWNPKVAIANNGDVVVTWRSQQFAGYNNNGVAVWPNYCYKVEKRSGVWTAAPTSFADRINSTGSCYAPEVAMSRNSNKAMIVWARGEGPIGSIEYNGLTWSSENLLSFGTNTYRGMPQVAISDNGQRFVVGSVRGSAYELISKELGNSWGPVSAFEGNNKRRYKIAVNNLGNIVIGYARNGSSLAKYGIAERVNGQWQPAVFSQDMAPPPAVAEPEIYELLEPMDLDLNRFGKVIFTWRTGEGLQYKMERLNFNLDFIPADALPNLQTGVAIGGAQVKVDDKCNAIMAWNDSGSVYKAEYE